MGELKITNEIVENAILKSQVFLGHKSGALTLVSKGILPNGGNLLIGQNPLTKVLTTMYSPSNLTRATKSLTKLSENYSQQVIKTLQNIHTTINY